MKLDFPRTNNLEWLRLLFAVQVAIVHAGEHLGVPMPSIVAHFPGVPAFFFVSGFLIYASYLNAPGKRYFQNRFLRLFPGLLFVTLGGAALMVFALGWDDLRANLQVYAGWIIGQITLGQAYNPAHFRSVGVGVVNGSLWTITTEIIFYFSVPFIVMAERRFRYTVAVLLAASFAIYAAGPRMWSTPVYREKTYFDILALTPLVWGWMFCFGMLAVKHFHSLSRWLKYAPLLLIPMILMGEWGSGPLFGAVDNRLGLAYFVCYIACALWLAFVVPYVRLRADFSYGAYVWHMPVVNLLLILSLRSVPLAVAGTLAAAAFSWYLVEKPALKLKRSTLKPV